MALASAGVFRPGAFSCFIHGFPLLKAEEKSLAFRRSIYVAKDVAAGETFTPENLRIVRPGYGLAPKFYDMLIGRPASRDLKAGTPASWDIVMS